MRYHVDVGTTQVAIRCNDQLLGELDWLVVRCDYESRAEAIRDALQRFIDAERSSEIGEQIAEGYRRMPQTQEEIDDLPVSDFSGLPDDEDWGDWF